MRWSSKFMSFWLTPTGQQTAGGLVCAAAVGGVLSHALPNGPFNYKYCEIWRAYNMGVPVALEKNVEVIAEEVIEKAARLSRDRNVTLFTAYGFDPCTIGSTKLRFGAWLGLPQNFNYEKPSDVKTDDLMVTGQTVKSLKIRDKHFPSSSEKGRQLVETLLYSPDAKRFLIARELRHAHSYDVVQRSLMTGAFVFLAYLWSFQLNRKLDLLSRPFKWRLALYVIVASLAGTIRLYLGDILQYQADKKGDEFAASLGPEFLSGGVEFYAKALERNVLLRDLLGPVEGPKTYTPTGNVIALLRQRHVPLTARKEALERRLAEREGELRQHAPSLDGSGLVAGKEKVVS